MQPLLILKKYLSKQSDNFKALLIRKIFSSLFKNFQQYQSLYISYLGADPLKLGYINSLGGVVNGLASLPTGHIIDKYGLKKAMLLGMTIELLGVLFLGLAQNLWMILPAMVLIQMSAQRGLTVSTENVAIANSVRNEERATSFSILTWVSTVTGLLSPVIAVTIIEFFGGLTAEGIRPLFLIQFLGLTPLAVVVYKKFKDTKLDSSFKNRRMTTTDLVKDFREILREEKAAKKFLVIEMVRSFDQSLRSPFTMIFAVAIKGATPLIIGWLGIASTLVNMLFSIPVGKLADKIGRKKTLILTRPIMYASFLTLIFAPSPEWLVLAWAEMGFPFEYMVWTTWEMETVSADKRGRWSGFLNLARNLVSIPAPIIGGLLYQFNPYILFVMPIILDLGIKLPLIIKCPETLRNRSEDPL